MKYSHFSTMTAAALALALPSVAAAQATVEPSAQTGWYLGVGTGVTNVSYDTSTFGPPPGGAWDSEDWKWGVKGFAGWRINKYFGIEGGYDYLGKFRNDYVIGGAAGTATSTVDGWVADAMGFLPFTPNLSAFARAGVVWGEIETGLVGTTPANLTSSSKRTTNFHWGLGAQWDINHRFAVRGEYENFGKFGDTNTGEMRVDMWSASALIKF